MRGHGILSDVTALQPERPGLSPYNFTYVDQIYDAILAVGTSRDRTELYPDCLKSGPETVFYWKGNITIPADYASGWHRYRRLPYTYSSPWPSRVETWLFEV